MKGIRLYRVVTLILLIALVLVVMLSYAFPIHYRTLTVTTTETKTNTLVITTTDTVTTTRYEQLTTTIYELVTVTKYEEKLIEVTITLPPVTDSRFLHVYQVSFNRIDKPDNKFDLELIIIVKNIGNETVKLSAIAIPNATMVLNIDVEIQPDVTYAGFYTVFIDKPYVENGVDWNTIWSKNTEHVVIILYYVENNPNPYALVVKGVVE